MSDPGRDRQSQSVRIGSTFLKSALAVLSALLLAGLFASFKTYTTVQLQGQAIQQVRTDVASMKASLTETLNLAITLADHEARIDALERNHP